MLNLYKHELHSSPAPPLYSTSKIRTIAPSYESKLTHGLIPLILNSFIFRGISKVFSKKRLFFLNLMVHSVSKMISTRIMSPCPKPHP